MIFWILLGVIVLAVVWVITMYNGLVKLKVRVEEAWADIEVQLKRRYNLIPNLVNTVKGYATHEKELFENVTKARANAMNAQGVEEKGKAENMLSGTLKSLFAVAENYPNLKANENFLSLQADLTDTEDKIMYSRRFYNGNVRDLNTKIQIFPSNIIANSFGFKMREMFEVENAEERKAVEVKF
ncbi:hypothetical protein A3J90_05970 [candidate division WOR-1 bacterium RIFOXYC2_FULL_37_10]|uniref:LemA family protein n=1 Tax=candidate division WOR-1 bacterium RIFOXYB2_FULL_37_13 TaxID=1802579 RepID=A0A1F4SWM6_UNCSA|nr:MAG: hypothetical protein A2246_06425 [candidate division WOR-1 bacterium RIFOXYA2_FULL_37_7]OGC24836.1 MAG: hypothetical protein A2310_03755 [candidate division WOR-1 bacterium RIFOXYB2_FULL_37_13]OGC34932.1 MAG: hypothetical protein A3J90_05970 [candidate division WOR-1 bacterium RIFOXYC2_FULL_37_10]